MDFKTVKQTMMVNETVFNTTGEIPLDEDFVLPDFYPEINKILKCKAIARINSKCINGTSIELDGHICINLMYCDKNGCIKNYEHIVPFSKNIEANDSVSGGVVHAKVKTEYINCRAITERKATVHGAFNITVYVKNKRQHEVVVEIEDNTVQTNCNEYKFLNAVGSAEKNCVIEQELSLSHGQQVIDSIVRCDAYPVITEIKPIKNKASIKGNLTISVLYTSGKQCIPYKSVVPFSQFVDIQGISEECICTGKVHLCFLEVKPKSIDGEWRSMMLNAKLSVNVDTFCEGEVPVINDAYSTKYELDMNRFDINLEKIVGHISDNFMFKKTIDFSEGTLGNIIDVWSEIEVMNCILNDCMLVINGNITICALVYDNDGRVCYHEKKTEFNFEKNAEFACDGNIVCTPVLEPVSSSYTLLSDASLEYRSEYRINMSISEEKKISLLKDIATNEENIKKQNECSLIVYFASKGENVWEIAKRYNTDIYEMKTINSLNEECLICDKQLLIPII